MIAKAQAKYVRISAKKMQEIVPLVKGKKALPASIILNMVNKKGAELLRKVLQSAIANAKKKGYDETKLFISKAVANQGPTLKRFRAASFGRASVVLKRTAHLVIELDSPEKLVEKAKIK